LQLKIICFATAVDDPVDESRAFWGMGERLWKKPTAEPYILFKKLPVVRGLSHEIKMGYK
jgi:hypothetical protein